MTVGGREIRSLTGLRGVAALWVVLFHFGKILYELVPAARRLSFVLDRGYLGVDLFFLLSGFVLAHAYGEPLRTWNARAHARFLRARLARIYPVHLLMLIAVGIAGAIAAHAGRPFDYAPTGARALALNLVLAHAWGASGRAWNVVSWAISAQWLGYLAVPFLFPLVSRVRSRATSAALAATALALLLAVFRATGVQDATYDGGALRFGLEFAAGLLLYRACAPTGVGAARSSAAVAAAGALLVLLAIHRADPWAVPLLALVLASVAGERGGVARVLSSRPAAFLGKISYSLYMTHHLAIWTLARIVPPSRIADLPAAARLGVAALEFGALIATGYIVHRIVESPLRHRLRG